MSGNAKKGDPLEVSTAIYFQAHGYLVRRGVMLSVTASTGDVTDIDLLGIRFHVPVREERIIVDCKDRKRSRPFERVLWTLGLASFTEAHRPIVVAPLPASNARDFASQGGVEVLAAEDVAAFAKTRATPLMPYSDADPQLSLKLARIASAKTLETKDLMRELLRVRQMLVVGNAITNFNRIVLLIQKLKSDKSYANDSLAWLRDCVCNNAAVVATVMLLRFVEEMKWTPEKDWRAALARRLTYGDVAPVKALQLARLALDQQFHDGLPPPEYTEEVAGLIAALISNPSVAVVGPMAVDFILFGEPNVGAAGGKIALMPDDLHSASLAVGRKIISTIGYASGIKSALIPTIVGDTPKLDSANPKPAQAALPIGDKSTNN